MKVAKDNEDSYIIDNAIENVHNAYRMMNPIQEKYNYQELPKK